MENTKYVEVTNDCEQLGEQLHFEEVEVHSEQIVKLTARPSRTKTVSALLKQTPISEISQGFTRKLF